MVSGEFLWRKEEKVVCKDKHAQPQQRDKISSFSREFAFSIQFYGEYD